MPEIDIIDTYNLSSEDKNIFKGLIEEKAISFSNQNKEMIFEICCVVQEFLNAKDKLYQEDNSKNTTNSKFSDLYKIMNKKKTSSGEEELNQGYLDNLVSKNLDYSKQINLESEMMNENNIITSVSRFKNDFTINEEVGKGGGGVVYKVKNKYDGMFYAVKKVIKLILSVNY